MEKYNKGINRHLRALTFEILSSGINRHLRALTFEILSSTDYKKPLPFVLRILNSNHRDTLKISASQMLFGNMLNLEKGIFSFKAIVKVHERSLSYTR